MSEEQVSPVTVDEADREFAFQAWWATKAGDRPTTRFSFESGYAAALAASPVQGDKMAEDVRVSDASPDCATCHLYQKALEVISQKTYDIWAFSECRSIAKNVLADASKEQNTEGEDLEVKPKPTAPSFSSVVIPKPVSLDADGLVEDHPYRWTIEPHPYDRSYDTFVTDSDDEAREALLTLWDIAEDHPTFSCVFDAAIASTQQSSEASHNED